MTLAGRLQSVGETPHGTLSAPVDLVLSRLEGVKAAGQDNWRARCPVHDDRHPSLTVKVSGDGTVLLKCRSQNCALDEIVAALGLTVRDLFPSQNGGSGPRQVVAEYDYTDEAGKRLFQVVRFAPKDFLQRRQVAGEWVWKLDDTRRVLYRLPQVIAAAQAGGTVYVAEGEKDVEALERAGAVATCNAGGAEKWKPEYSECLRGAHVVIVADKDDKGRAHAAAVLASVTPLAASVRVVEAAEGKDASDHLAAGHGLEAFVPVEADAPPPALEWLTGAELAALTPEDPDYVLAPYLARGLIVQLAGKVKGGKTTLAMHMAAAVLQERPFLEES